MTRVPLVVGGAGFIGSSLVRLLADAGPVRVLDDLSTGSSKNIAGVAGVDLVEASVLDDDALAESMRGISVVYHLACLGVRHSIHRPMENHQVNALGTLKVLETARLLDVDRVVHCSTSEVYGTAEWVPMDESHPTSPHTVYGAAKLAGDAYARAYHVTYGLPTVVVRPFNAFGPRSHHEGDSGEVIPKFLVRAKNGLAPVIFGDGSQTRDFTYVEDSARGIAAAGHRHEAVGQTINLGSGEETAISDVAALVTDAAGRPDLEPVHHRRRPGDVLRLCSDSSKAAALLGWKPQVSLPEGLGRLLAWHAEQRTDWAVALTQDELHSWEPDG